MAAFTGHETATTVTCDAVTYHRTTVFRVNADGTVTINSGGYETATTTKRINQAAAHFRRKLRAFRKDFSLHLEWTDDSGDEHVREYPGEPMTINPARYGW